MLAAVGSERASCGEKRQQENSDNAHATTGHNMPIAEQINSPTVVGDVFLTTWTVLEGGSGGLPWVF